VLLSALVFVLLSAALLSVVVFVSAFDPLSDVEDVLPQPAKHPATMAAVNKILTGFFIINFPLSI
jgi:hypothetical protein